MQALTMTVHEPCELGPDLIIQRINCYPGETEGKGRPSCSNGVSARNIAILWISVDKTNYAILWRVIYTVDSIIHRFNNSGQVLLCELITCFYDFSYCDSLKSCALQFSGNCAQTVHNNTVEAKKSFKQVFELQCFKSHRLLANVCIEMTSLSSLGYRTN